MKIKQIILLIFVSLTSIVFSQEVKVNAVLDTNKIRIGEQAKIDLYVNYDANQKNIKIEWPSIGDTITQKVEVISISPIDSTLPDKINPGRLLQHQQITISVYDSGMYVIPSFKFILNSDTSKPLLTEPLFLEVHTVPTDTSLAKTKDIKPPFGESFNWKWYLNYIYAGIGLLALLVAVVVITTYYNKKRNQQVIEPEKPKIPPHILALAALEKIKLDEVWKDGKIKEYYSSISDTIRLYIEDRFVLNALESTTDEIMLAFRSQVVDKESKEKLQQLLMLSDLVKFAKQFPIEVEHQFTLQNAFDFVNGTKREEEMDAALFTEEELEKNVQSSLSRKIETTPTQKNSPSYQAPTNSNKNNSKNYRKPYQEKEVSNTKIFIGVVVIVSILIATIFFTTQIVKSAQSGLQSKIFTESINKQCPIMIDQEARLDKVEMLDEKTLCYYYTLVNYSVGDIDASAIENNVRPIMINTVKNSPELQFLREVSGTLQYQYNDKSGNPMLLVSVTSNDYKN